MGGLFTGGDEPHEPTDSLVDAIGIDVADHHGLPPLHANLDDSWDLGEAPETEEAVALVGDPHHDAHFWQPQTTGFTSVVMAERGIIEALTGEDVSEAQLVYEATACRFLTDRGMSPEDVGEILQMHGVSCHHNDHASVEDLVAELSLGHKVIVGVDADELRDPAHPLAQFTGQAADHAIWITGVDESDPDHPKVMINDSGDPHGAGRAYDLDRFVDAWEHAGFRYVATDGAPDHRAAEAACAAAASAFGLLLAVRLGAANRVNTSESPSLPAAATMRALEDGRSRRQQLDFTKLDAKARDALIRRL